MADLWTLLYEGLLTTVFGSPLALGFFLLIITAFFYWLIGSNKVLIFPMLLFMSYGFWKFGMMPVQVFGVMLLLVGVIFAYALYNVVVELTR